MNIRSVRDFPELSTGRQLFHWTCTSGSKKASGVKQKHSYSGQNWSTILPLLRRQTNAFSGDHCLTAKGISHHEKEQRRAPGKRFIPVQSNVI
jgi:hypothetical protein